MEIPAAELDSQVQVLQPCCNRVQSQGGDEVSHVCAPAGDLSSSERDDAVGMRAHENGFHSRAPSQSNASDGACDDAAVFASAAAHQPASSALQRAPSGPSHSHGQDGESQIRSAAAVQ